MERPYRDRDWLERKYHGEGLTQREIAEACGVSPRTIRTYMTRYGIETREVEGENHGMYGKARSEEVKQQISEKLTDREFSDPSIRRMSEAHRGHAFPEDVRAKISDSLRGIPKSEETRRRMRRAKRGMKNTRRIPIGSKQRTIGDSNPQNERYINGMKFVKFVSTKAPHAG